MKRSAYGLHKAIKRAEETAEALPKIPIVEIAGDRRVLIENHSGVIEYGYEKIVIRLNYGLLQVCGSQMCLAQMTKEQLVIHGRIDGISMIREDGK